MQITSEHDEFFTLLSGWVEGELTDAEIDVLDAWLQRDENARAIYVHYMALQLDVKEHAELEAASPIEFDAATVCRPTKPFRRWLYATAAAVALLAGIIIGRGLNNESNEDRIASTGADHRPQIDEGVAIVTEIVGNALEGGFREGSILHPGKIQVASGYIRVEFYQGAAAVIKGPATIHLQSDNAMTLDHGVMHAHVPPEATGFTVDTPFAQVIDRGTAFGVVVNEEEGLKTRVYAGKVEVVTNDPKQINDLQELEGLQITPSGQMRHWDGTGDPVISGTALQEIIKNNRQIQFGRRHLRLNALRDDPATVLLYTGQGLEPWSRKITNQVATKRASDGILVGSRTVEGRFAGERAIAFGGLADRIRFEMSGDYDSLTVAGWFRFNDLPNLYSSLVMADGFDSGEFHWQVNNFGHVRIGVQSPTLLDGANYESGYTIGENHFGRWIHLAFTYDLSSKTVRHYLNGEVVDQNTIILDVPIKLGKAEIGNWTPTATDSNAPFRGFRGNMDQLLISSRAFSPEEMTTLYRDGYLD